MDVSKLAGFAIKAAAAAALICSISVQAAAPTLVGSASSTLVETGQWLDETESTSQVFSQTVDVQTGAEFVAILGGFGIEWTLDLQDGGFSLHGECVTESDCDPVLLDEDLGVDIHLLESVDISLALTGLTWDPVSQLVGVSIISAVEISASGGVSRNFASDITPQVHPNAMNIEFTLLDLRTLGSSVSVVGQFLTERIPEPSVWALLAAGALFIPFFGRQRTAAKDSLN